jgi:HlyD family secretion protein
MKKKLIILLIAVALLAVGFVYTRYQDASEGGDLTLYGNVDIRDVVLGFRTAGRLDAVHFEEGDEVDKGAVMAELDSEPFTEEIELREAELAEANAALDNADKLFRRRAKLETTGAVSKEAYDDALAARDQALARLRTANARLKRARTQLEDATLIAPDAGTILTRVREPGAIVSVGAPVYTLALRDPVWVRTYIDEPNLGRIHPGMTATVTTDSGGRYTGQVGFISPQAEFTPKNVETRQLRTDLVYRLRVIVDNPDQGLRQGMPVTVTLDQDTPDGG